MVTVGRPTGTSTTTPSSGIYYSGTYTVIEAFTADRYQGPFTGAGNIPTGCSTRWETKTSATSGSWTTRYTASAGTTKGLHAFNPVTLQVGTLVRFVVVHNGSVSGQISTGSNWPAEMRAYITGPGLHIPTVNVGTPSTGQNFGTNLRPGLTFSYSDAHPMKSIFYTISQGSTVIRTFSVNNTQETLKTSYTYDEMFDAGAADLPRGGSFTYSLKVTCDYGGSNTRTGTFTTASSTASIGITAPPSGTYNLNPTLAGFATNNYGESVTATNWSILGKGSTVPGFNSMSTTYDNGGDWASYSPLAYGQTYTATLTVTFSDGTTATTSRGFSILPYKPVATITAPLASKLDTLTPTISASYSSAISNAKTQHIVSVYRGTSLVARKTVNDSSAISHVYDNTDSSWSIFTSLQWATTYAILVQVKDDEDILSDGTLSLLNPGYKIFITDRYPTAPTNLSPPNGGVARSLQPYLTATFNDPDIGDTPATMEVEVRGVTDPDFTFSRIESDGNTSFRILLSDDLVVDNEYIWRVRFTDQAGLLGEWSVWSGFTVEEGVDVNFTNPLSGDTLDTPIQTFTWDYTHALSVAQASGRLRIYTETGGIPIYDSGTVLGTYESQALPATLLQNNSSYRAVVSVEDANGDTATTPDIFFTTEWVGPPQAQNLTAVVDNPEATVSLNWSINILVNFMMYRVYRRDPLYETEFTLVDEIYDRLRNNYLYYFAPSGRPYQYAVTVVINESGALLESKLEDYVTAQLDFPHHTWVNDEVDPLLFRQKLQYNPARSEAFQREQKTLQAIGRKFPVTHYGNSYTETLNLSFMVHLPYSERDMIKKLIERGNLILYRDGRGRKHWGNISNYGLSDDKGERGTLTFTFTTSDSKDR
jgi:hypothetical protein